MKLRLRSSESKETLKIEILNSCTLSQLRRILSETLPNSPSPTSIRLSLNRKDELKSDGEDSLQFLGVAPGDLIFFSIEQPAAVVYSDPQSTVYPVTDSTQTPISIDPGCSTSLNTETSLPGFQNPDSVMLDSRKGETLDSSSRMVGDVNDMEVSDEDNKNSSISDGLLEEVVHKSISVPGFLRKVFAEELGDDDGSNHKMIVIAIHAVMLESGFVGFDEKANKALDGFRFSNGLPSGLFTLSLSYALPHSVSGAHSEAVEGILLKFQSLGKFMNIYGTLGCGSGKRGMHWVRLNEVELVPFLNAVWANCGAMQSIRGKDGGDTGTSPEKEVFKFWMTVKDNLALPLLIDLCEAAGLELPPCFMRLPTELKLKILESLPGVDLAKVSSVCSEFRYLASSDDLWKLKFTEEFSNENKGAHVSWKMAFSTAWERRCGGKNDSRVRRAAYWPAPYWAQPRRRRGRSPFIVPRVPRIIGGEYDVSPFHGDDLQTRLHDPVNHPMRSFSPQCNLGVRGGRFV